jgi:hypothetical protein
MWVKLGSLLSARLRLLQRTHSLPFLSHRKERREIRPPILPGAKVVCCVLFTPTRKCFDSRTASLPPSSLFTVYTHLISSLLDYCTRRTCLNTSLLAKVTVPVALLCARDHASSPSPSPSEQVANLKDKATDRSGNLLPTSSARDEEGKERGPRQRPSRASRLGLDVLEEPTGGLQVAYWKRAYLIMPAPKIAFGVICCRHSTLHGNPEAGLRRFCCTVHDPPMIAAFVIQ